MSAPAIEKPAVCEYYHKAARMEPLLMPSDLKGPQNASGEARADDALVEPPSVKLIVRLFLIPLLIVAAAVGVMFLIGMLAGGEPSFDEAINRLKSPGGGRTAEWLIGPGAKQRYIDAKTVTDKMKRGMTVSERVSLAGQLIDLLDNYTEPDEGDVRHFLLLALGRVWQQGSGETSDLEWKAAEAVESRNRVVQSLLRYAEPAQNVQTRKAAILALAYWAGRDEVQQAIPMLIQTVTDESQDLDVRLAAATVLGPIGEAATNGEVEHSVDPKIVSALQFAMRDTDKRNIELVWASALSLAQLNQPEVADIILRLLDRSSLAELEYYDRESDPKNPSFRKLNEQEQQRILINTMLGARRLEVAQVRSKLKELAESDPSPRVREAGIEINAQLSK